MNAFKVGGLSLLLFALLMSTATAMTFKVATIAPEGSYWITEMRKASETIKVQTAGRVNFKFYTGGVMGGENNVLRKIRLGQLHGGMFTGGGLEPVYPDLRLYSLPLLFNNLEEVDYVRERLDGPLRAGFEQAGFVSFGFAEGGFALMMSKTPIRTLADMDGRKVWVPEGDRVYYESMAALGLSPVSLPITDVLTGLQTGLVEVVGTSPIGALIFQWQTKIAYLTTTPMTYVMGVFALDKGAFDKVKEEDQQVVRDVMEPLFIAFDRRNRIDNREALNVLREQGVTIIDQTPVAAAEFRQRTRKAIDILAAEGFFDRELLRQLEAHLDDFRRSHQP